MMNFLGIMMKASCDALEVFEAIVVPLTYLPADAFPLSSEGVTIKRTRVVEDEEDNEKYRFYLYGPDDLHARFRTEVVIDKDPDDGWAASADVHVESW